jgi:ferredoxin
MLRLMTAADALCNRLYGQRFNPLYQSGTVVLALYLVLVTTGLWLVVLYRVGAPWESVAALTANPWIGNWVRGLHRYASDLAVVATAVHAFRMFAQARNTGARTMAWVSGSVLLLLLLICGWTGYVMVWDRFGHYLAREGARMIDVLPVLSEPTSRAFTGEQPVATVFFFLNLFAHIGIPLAMGAVFWLHVKRLQRPQLLPPRPVTWAVIAALTAAAIVRPLIMTPRADALTLPAGVPADVFFAFWLPLSRRLSGGHALLVAAAFGIGLLIIPRLGRRSGSSRPPSVVDEDLCVGCLQCALDCPYGAISMVARSDHRPDLVARVDSQLCVSCGICAGSCAPMGVGPPGRGGRDQLERVRTYVSSGIAAGRVAVIGCEHAVGGSAGRLAAAGAVPYSVECGGNLHTSVVELLLRAGAAGVMIVACPPRDCWHREGPRWLEERLFQGREAELQPRVDRERVRFVTAGAGDSGRITAAVSAFTAQLDSLKPGVAAQALDTEPQCEPPIAQERA